jgi:CBS domain-containing protein
MWVNIVLAVFNLLPAFPMDGGRVLRAALAMRMSFAQATELAARIGKVFALLFALAGLFVVNNPFLVIIAAFVWLSAAAEATAAQLKDTVGNVPVAKAMITEIRALEPDEPVSTAIEEIRGGFQHDFPIVHDHTVQGMLTREDLLGALAHGRANIPVADVMHREFASTTPEESIERAMERLRDCHCRTLPVMRGNEVVGLLTADKISEFVMIASAAKSGRRAA